MAAVNPGVYRDVLRVRAAYPFDIACVLMRFFTGMMNIGVVTMITLSGYSFLTAGLVSSTIALSTFLVGPRVSKLIDRLGQPRVVPVAAAVSLVGLAVLVGTVLARADIWPLFLGAVLVGCYPSPHAMARTRWTYLIRSGKLGKAAPELQTMFSYESVLDDMTFIFSPSISIALAASVHPVAGMVAGGLAFAVGAAVLCVARSTAPVPGWLDAASPEEEAGALAELEAPELEAAGAKAGEGPAAGRKTRREGAPAKEKSLIRLSVVVRVLFTMYVFLGSFLGLIDTATVSLAEDLGDPDIASFVLVVQGIVSMCVGFAFGMVRLRAPLPKQLAVAAVAVGLGFGTMYFVSSAASLVIVGIIGASTYAPLLIVANTTCERAVPQRRLTEAITWLNAGFTCGCAVGPSLAGAVIDGLGTLASFKVGSVLSLGLAVTGILTYRIVRRQMEKIGYTVVEKREL